MKRLSIYLIIAITICGCQKKPTKKAELFFLINESVPFERMICFPYEINIDFLNKKKIKSYILYDSKKNEDDFIFSYHNSMDSPTVYVQTGWVEKFYYNDNQLDSVIFYSKNDSGQLSFYTREFYIYKNEKIDSIKYLRPGESTSFSYTKDITVRKRHKIVPPTVSIDSFFYMNGKIEKVIQWNSKSIEELGTKHGFSYKFEGDRLIKVSSLYDNFSYNLNYDQIGNLVSVSASPGGKLDLKYNSDGILTELIMNNGDIQWSYTAKIEYQ